MKNPKKRYNLAAKCCELILMDRPYVDPFSQLHILYMTYKIMSQRHTIASFEDTRKHVEYLYCRRRETDEKSYHEKFDKIICLDNLKSR